ncbi:hypothetical protein B0A49_01548 [Cryomyces minteri]|uniref:Uncharacterized protein n=1 Tax=Cryomyces minteri TaxID=331657 RepID=A0A4U0XR48_9PEZI|nr:hypothetical protein B0A49_01548 [Cryomyces minteri]
MANNSPPPPPSHWRDVILNAEDTPDPTETSLRSIVRFNEEASVLPSSPDTFGSKPSEENEEQMLDPFEPLGQALSEYHERVRHVPYLPSIGITPAHVAFLQRACAVIVAVCEPPVTQSPKPNWNIPLQKEFVKSIARTLESGSAVPLTIVCCGCTDASKLEAFEPYDNIVQSESCAPSALRHTAELLFGECQ